MVSHISTSLLPVGGFMCREDNYFGTVMGEEGCEQGFGGRT
jgi:hypothetical protein